MLAAGTHELLDRLKEERLNVRFDSINNSLYRLTFQLDKLNEKVDRIIKYHETQKKEAPPNP